VAVVGEASIIIRPITTGFAGAVKKDLDRVGGLAGSAGSRAGKQFGGAFGKAFGPTGRNIFSNDQIAKALATGKTFASLNRQGMTLQTTLSMLLGGIGSVLTAIVSLGAAVAAAAPSILVLGSVLTSVAVGAIAAKLALGGVGQALSKYLKAQKKGAKDTTAADDRIEDAYRRRLEVIERNKEAIVEADAEIAKATKEVEEAQLDYNKALEEANETIQQLGFDAEDAALAEKKAALELEKAREGLQRAQDLPPNSRARKEAELAYAEAELNLRKAKDRNGDLAKEQERLAKTGPAGVEGVVRASEKLADAAAAVEDAEMAKNKTILEGARAQADAQRELDRAKRDKKTAAVDDPLEGLNESQKEFVKFLASLKPKIDAIKKAASDAFLPKLTEAIKLLAKEAFPVIETGVGKVGDALGNASITIAKAITESGNLKDLATLFENAATNIELLGRIIGNVWGIFLSYAKALQPLTERFLKYLDGATKKYEEYLDTPEGAKALEDFFNTAGDVAAEIGQVFKEAFGALGVIIKANVGPGTGGQFLLDWLEGSLKGFKEFGKTVEGQQELKEFFLQSSKNAASALSAVGAFFKEILKAGADPNVGKAFDILKGGSDAFGSILTKSNEAAPSLATLVVNIIKIIDLITDSGQIKTFFDTLNVAAVALKKVLENDVVQAIMNVTGPITGFLLAFGLVKIILLNVGSFVLFLVIKGFNLLVTVFGVITKAVQIFTTVFRLLSAALIANPIAAIVLLIVGLIAIFVTLYKKNEAFREIVDKVWAAVKNAIGVAVDFIIAYFKTIIEFGAKLWGWIFDVLKDVWDKVFAFFETVYTIFKTIVEIIIGIGLIIWDFLYDKIQAVWELVAGWWNETILPFITGIVETVAEFGAMIWDWIYDKIMAVWGTVKGYWDKTIYPFVSNIVKNVKDKAGAIWDFISGTISGVWAKVTGFFTNTIYPFISGIGAKIAGFAKGMWDGLKNGLESVVNFIIRGVNLIIRGINLLIKAANAVKIGDDIKEIRDILPVNFAQGGIVPATPGGMLARIGEAGRAERVEPLDPDGLSKRDKAMIQLLSGGAGGGTTINVYPSQGMNESELAEIVSRKIAFAMRKGAA
jgi:Mg2+ and Co2+ transporter CorA